MLLVSLVLVMTVVGLVGIALRDNREDGMNLYCYNECAEGKHYKRKLNSFHMV